MVKQAGTSNWSKVETEFFLTILEDVLPLSPADWEEVKALFDAKYSNKQRAVSALQRRFTTLHRTKEPTGNPNIPSTVSTAKMIRSMIDEKTDGTRGSADSKNEEEDDEEEDLRKDTDDDDLGVNNESFAAAANPNPNDSSITPLTHNAVYELARLGGSAEKPFFTPIVQVVNLRKKSGNEFYDVTLSDSTSYILGTCSPPVSALADEGYFILFSLIKVEEFATTTLSNGNKSCQLLRVENTMIPNPGKKIGNPVNISLRLAPRQHSPIPTSVQFGQSLRSMKMGSAKKSGGAGGGGDGDEFNNIMRIMLMQQQSDREQRIADREHRNFQAEQDKIEREERARLQQLQQEERANQAREDRIQQQQDRMQQQQFMNMMMMQMMGGGKKRARDESDSDIDDTK